MQLAASAASHELTAPDEPSERATSRRCAAPLHSDRDCIKEDMTIVSPMMISSPEDYALDVSIRGNSSTRDSLRSGRKTYRRTFILYLEPSSSSRVRRQLSTARNVIGQQIGFDSSHLYPIHCSLTSFFDVLCDERDYFAVVSALKESFVDFTDQRLTGKPLEPTRKTERQGHYVMFDNGEKMGASELTRTHLESTSPSCAADRTSSTRVSTTASGTASRVKDSESGGDAEHADLASTKLASAVPSKPSMSPADDVTRKTEQIMLYVETKATDEKIARSVDRYDVLNSQLRNVHVTGDGGIIMPLSFRWRESEQSYSSPGTSPVQLLCGLMDRRVAALDSARIVTDRSVQQSGIRRKNGQHLTLLGKRARWTTNVEHQLVSIARLLDTAADHGTEALSWDIVLHEVQEWGQLKETLTEEDKPEQRETNWSISERGSCLSEKVLAESQEIDLCRRAKPHDFVEIARLPQIGITYPMQTAQHSTTFFVHNASSSLLRS